MTQPAFYLFSPSREDAIRLGMGEWYDWFQSQENVQVVNDISAVSEGVFISFGPVREERDTFPDLEGRADRWLALDSTGNVSSSCHVAKKAGIDRLLHARLIDEMSSPVIPSALLYLMDRGIWLPDTLLKTSGLAIPETKPEETRAAKLLMFLIDEAFVESSRLQFLLELLKEDLNPFGYETKVTSIQEFGSEVEPEVPSHLVLFSDRSEFVLEVSRWATANSVIFAVWEDIENSPLRYIFAGGMYPETIGVSKLKLRACFKELGSFLNQTAGNRLEKSDPNPGWHKPRSTSDFEFAFGRVPQKDSPYRPPVFATALSSNRGDDFVKWVKSRISVRSGLQYTPLYYSCEFFRQYDPFDLLCDDDLRSSCHEGLSRLREMLETGYRVSNGYGAMYVLHLGWCSILLGECNKVIEYFEGAREPNFSALSGYASELALALWYLGEIEEGAKCIQYCIRLEMGKVELPTLFSLSRSLVEGDRASDEPVFNEESVELKWIDFILRALVLGEGDHEAWRLANEQESERTQQFLARAKDRKGDW